VAGSNLFTQAQIFGIKNGKMGTLKNDVNPFLCVFRAFLRLKKHSFFVVNIAVTTVNTTA